MLRLDLIQSLSAGHNISSGFVAWIGDPSQANAVIVDALTRLGAVHYLETAAPPGT